MDNPDIRQAKANHKQELHKALHGQMQPDQSAPPIALADYLQPLPPAPNRRPVPPIPASEGAGSQPAEPSLFTSKCAQLLSLGHFQALEKFIQSRHTPPEHIAYDLLEQSLSNQSLDQFKWVLSQWAFSSDTIDVVVKNPAINTFIKLYAVPFASPRGVEDLSHWMAYTHPHDPEGHLLYCAQVVRNPLSHLNILHSALRNNCPDPLIVQLVDHARPYMEQLDVNDEEVRQSLDNVGSTFLVKKSDLVTRSVLSLPHAVINSAFTKECARGNVELVEWMTQLPSFDPKKLGSSPLSAASQNHRNDIVDILFDLWDLEDVKKYINPPSQYKKISDPYLYQKLLAAESKQELEQVFGQKLSAPMSDAPKSKM